MAKKKKIKLHLPADWALRFRAKTEEDNRSAHRRRNSKESKRQRKNELNGD